MSPHYVCIVCVLGKAQVSLHSARSIKKRPMRVPAITRRTLLESGIGFGAASAAYKLQRGVSTTTPS